MDRLSPHGDVAQRNWSTALHTYRTALAAYRRLLEVQTKREAGRVPPEAERVMVALPRSLTPRSLAPRCHVDGLTPRECEVAALIARGYSNRQIADALVLTRGTVANHVAHILAKLGAANRTQVAARVFEATEGHAGPPEEPVVRLSSAETRRHTLVG
jgi:DNA-binding NarL/FixJ family response regulator